MGPGGGGVLVLLGAVPNREGLGGCRHDCPFGGLANVGTSPKPKQTVECTMTPGKHLPVPELLASWSPCFFHPCPPGQPL